MIEYDSHFSYAAIISDIQKTVVNELQSVDENILKHSDTEIVELLLYGSNKYRFQQNCSISKSTIKSIVKSQRFRGSLL